MWEIAFLNEPILVSYIILLYLNQLLLWMDLYIVNLNIFKLDLYHVRIISKPSSQTSCLQQKRKDQRRPLHQHSSRQRYRSIHSAVADCIRTSLGPRGMDKMIRDSRGETLITNDGATILQKLDVVHPTAKMVLISSSS